MEESTNTGETIQEKNYIRDIIEWVVYFVVVFGLALLLHTYVGQQVQVDGHSMQNTLEDRERLILEKISYRFGNPERFDIIVFRPYEDEKNTFYIKRVIGLPGEQVQIIDSTIYINGVALKENYGKELIEDAGLARDGVLLADDEYFVLGDNRNNSIDSRDQLVGLVQESAIKGKAWLRIWPLNKFGILPHE